MTEVKIDQPPRRSRCRRCGALIRRLYTGRGRSIVLEREKDEVHRCSAKKS